jgi:hypothetical protein
VGGIASKSDAIVNSRYFNKLRRRWWGFTRRRGNSRCLDRSNDPVLAARAIVLGVELQIFLTASRRDSQVLEAARFARVLQIIKIYNDQIRMNF